MTESQTKPRSGFAPTVGLGVLAAVLSVVASTKPWLEVGDGASVASATVVQSVTEAPPLASALSLVLLASWGALLVTRGRFRRLVAVLAAVASIVLGGISIGFATRARADAEATLASLGATDVAVSLGNWFWIALVSALGSVVLAGLAVVSCSRWPEMSRRYDAPSDGSDPKATDLTSTIDVWKAMDQGKDPTA